MTDVLTRECATLQPGTREAASNPIVIILSVVISVVMVFFLANYALYVFAHSNKPRKAGKRVSQQDSKPDMLRFNCVCALIAFRPAVSFADLQKEAET